MSYKPEFEVDGKWCDNAQRFATRAEAQQSASERYMSWTLPTGCRAAESDDPVNYKRVNGRDKHVG